MAGLKWFLISTECFHKLGVCVEKIIMRCGSISNHGPDEEKNKHVEARCLRCNPAQTDSGISDCKGSLCALIFRQMPLLKEQRRDLNKLKEPPRRWSSREKEGCGSLQCVHWEEWMNKLKAMAFLAIFKAMRHYWFLKRKRILNVSGDPGFLSPLIPILTLFLQLLGA